MISLTSRVNTRTLLTPEKSSKFVCVNSESIFFAKVKQIFTESIAPLYGSQDKAINQIYESTDRTCELLLDNADDPKGILVYKNALQDEFADHGIKNSLEIKTLMVVKPKENSGKGFGRQLIERINDIATEKVSDGIHVTVSQNAEGPKTFFEHFGFKTVMEWESRYAKGVKEYLLFKSV